MKAKRRSSKKDHRELRKVHDRRASNLPANAMVRVVTVDDPYEASAKIAAVASLRDDPLGRLRARRQIA